VGTGAAAGTGALLSPGSFLPGVLAGAGTVAELPRGWGAVSPASPGELASAERFCLQPAAWSQRCAPGLPQLDFLTDGQFNEPMYRGSFKVAIIPINLFAAGLE